MDGQYYLGIYLGETTATVVCLDAKTPNPEVVGCFSVAVEQSEEHTYRSLASLIAKGCDERKITFSEAAVALDCRMFMQHNVHSEFADSKQIAATIRFDTEEVLSTDISDVAVAFKIASTVQAGSKLAVFTAKRKTLSEILLSLQSNNIDPVAVEPDINCLSRFILQNVPVPESSSSLYAMLSASSGYFIAFAKTHLSHIERTFLIKKTQNRSDLLLREVPITIAFDQTGEPVNRLEVFDAAGTMDCIQLAEKLGIEVNALDLTPPHVVSTELLADCTDAVGFAIAFGAALTHSKKTQSVNFRDDFMPYQGKKVRFQKTVKILTLSVAALCIAVGLYFQVQLMQKNKYRNQLQKKIEKQYAAVMLGQKMPPKTNFVNKLKSEKKRIENAKSGQLSATGEETISAKMTALFESFNQCAAQTDLNIDSISITTKAVNIAGDTSSMENTLKLFSAIKGSENSQKRLQPKGARNSFSITIVPEKK